MESTTSAQKDQKRELINDVIYEMQPQLQKEEILQLEACMLTILQDYRIESECRELSTQFDDNYKYLKMFVASGRLEGMSETTMAAYVRESNKLFETINKNFRDVTTVDVQWYLSDYMARHPKLSRRSLDNIRRMISGFFLWLERNAYVDVNPMKRIGAIAYEKKPVEILSDESIVLIREYLSRNRDPGTIRTRAIVELLLATGVRVSELIAIEIIDINLFEDEIKVNCAKKRQKQKRVLFLTPEAIFYIKEYLKLREKRGWINRKELFQANKRGGGALTERCVNEKLKEIGKELGIQEHCTVHLFRKTLASRLHKRGMSNTDIAYILGHVDSRTSETYYIQLNIQDIKRTYKRLY